MSSASPEGPAPSTSPGGTGPLTRRRLSPRRIAAGLSALLGLVATITGLYTFYADHFTPHPIPPMIGDLNIALAEFDQRGPDSISKPLADRSGFADSLQNELRQQLAPLAARGFQVQLRSASQTGPLDGASPKERAEQAERRARQLNAQILVYGTLGEGEDASFLSPEFYIAPDGLPDAEELVGHFAFGSPIRVPGNATTEPVARRDLRRQAVVRAHALVQFMLGLAWYRANQLNDATAAFAAAEETGGWDARDGKEVLYLFAGNTAGKLRRYQNAIRAYTFALTLNPNYARARLGLGEVYLHQAARSCTPGGADVPGLRRSMAMFDQARTAADQPPLSDVAIKAAFQLGRAYLCLSLTSGRDQLETAKENFNLVIREFDGGNHRIRHLAAESHFGLALIAAPPAGDRATRPKLEQVAAEYRKALALSGDDPARQQIFYRHLSETYDALGRAADAQAAREHAAPTRREPVIDLER
jgi:tetratricopeptide (TPR) repeat protein